MDHPFALPRKVLKQRLIPYLDQDMPYGDLSSGLIPVNAQNSAKIRAKSVGTVAGLEEAILLFKICDVQANTSITDGDQVKPGDIILELNGNTRNILMAERTALNFLMHLSSIASSTADYVRQVRANNLETIIAATRKVIPGCGWFEKKAVFLGGGDPHRWNLSDMVMLKDTHLKFFGGDIPRMLQHARKTIGFTKKIEIEVEKPEDVRIAVENGADIVMLDNMKPEMIKATITEIKQTSNRCPLFEASGNITVENFLSYAQAGVDIISTSQLILHPHCKMDYSLRLD
jgi:nicotinate-nucleotide pyrophosphorylase (carboxylating)